MMWTRFMHLFVHFVFCGQILRIAPVCHNMARADRFEIDRKMNQYISQPSIQLTKNLAAPERLISYIIWPLMLLIPSCSIYGVQFMSACS